MTLLTTGNAAKLYCLNWLDATIQQHDGKVSILDLGCGTAQNFVALLKQHPEVVSWADFFAAQRKHRSAV